MALVLDRICSTLGREALTREFSYEGRYHGEVGTVVKCRQSG